MTDQNILNAPLEFKEKLSRARIQVSNGEELRDETVAEIDVLEEKLTVIQARLAEARGLEKITILEHDLLLSQTEVSRVLATRPDRSHLVYINDVLGAVYSNLLDEALPLLAYDICTLYSDSFPDRTCFTVKIYTIHNNRAGLFSRSTTAPDVVFRFPGDYNDKPN